MILMTAVNVANESVVLDEVAFISGQESTLSFSCCLSCLCSCSFKYRFIKHFAFPDVRFHILSHFRCKAALPRCLQSRADTKLGRAANASDLTQLTNLTWADVSWSYHNSTTTGGIFYTYPTTCAGVGHGRLG